MRRFLFASLGMIAMALPGCAPAVAPPPRPPVAPPVALLPPAPPPPAAPMPHWRSAPPASHWHPAVACPDPVTGTVRVTRRYWHHGHRVTRVRFDRRIVACNRYHPPSVAVTVGGL